MDKEDINLLQTENNNLVSEEKCPICNVGRNSKSLGGSNNCFHCDTCGFVECNFNKDGATEWTEIIKERLLEFYNRKYEFPKIDFEAW